jgi:hypothetical protein
MFSLFDYRIYAMLKPKKLLQIESHYPCRFCNIDSQCFYYNKPCYNDYFTCPITHYQLRGFYHYLFIINQLNDLNKDCQYVIRLLFYNINTPKCIDNKNKIIQYRINYLKQFDFISLFTLKQLKDLILTLGLRCPKNQKKSSHQYVLFNHRSQICNQWSNDYQYPLNIYK